VAHETIALIPARGGSKRIPNKNIRRLAGKPCIQYTIECALKAGITRVIVSTDSSEIAEVAKLSGADVPFIRPDKLAEDHVLDFPVVEHCLDYLQKYEDYTPDNLVFLRPTMPTRKPEEIIECLSMLVLIPEADCVRTTCPVPYPPYWMKRINEEGLLEAFCDDVRPYQNTRSQDLPETVMCDGYVDVCRVPVIRKYRQVVAGKILACHQKDKIFIDLDEEADWQYAEYLLKHKLIY
jgi:CMP-N,N'-diacetyllegionaminic acid synthase